jgi:hypothetical protein
VDGREAETLIDVAEIGRTGLTGPDSRSALAELQQRYPELIEAMQWFIEAGRADDALRLAGALVPFWLATKRIGEGDAWLERLLAIPGGDAARRDRRHGRRSLRTGPRDRVRHDDTDGCRLRPGTRYVRGE